LSPKARLLTRWFKQGVDYYETFASTIKWLTIRIVIFIATIKKWIVKHLDIKITFLNEDLDQEVLMEIPEGLRHLYSGNLVCKLKKALHGLKQASRAKLTPSYENKDFREVATIITFTCSWKQIYVSS
jgi:hypothetical protein